MIKYLYKLYRVYNYKLNYNTCIKYILIKYYYKYNINILLLIYNSDNLKNHFWLNSYN